MGTRAAFWIGDPRDTTQREWLGCIAWDGYPSGLPGLEAVQTETQFREFVTTLHARKDFATPNRGWPFPWADDIFLTDYTYCWIEGKGLTGSLYHQGLVPFEQLESQAYQEGPEDPTVSGVHFDKPYDPSQPDSIMILSARR